MKFLIAIAVATALAVPARAATPAIPIPSTNVTSAPAYQGAPATPNPITGIQAAPQNPFMAANGRSEIHDDGWQTDTYAWSGPLGAAPVTQSTLLSRDCGSIAFDRAGRLVSVCIGLSGPQLYMLDPSSLATIATFSLPGRALGGSTNFFQDFTGGGYFYLDQGDRVVTSTTTHHIFVIAENATGDEFVLQHDYDLRHTLTNAENITSALPDSNGLLWFVAKTDGVVATLNLHTGAIHALRLGQGADGEIENSFAVGAAGDVYIASDRRLYRFAADPQGVPQIQWQIAYPNSHEHKPGQVDDGTGTTPTILPGGYVAITDNADPMDIAVYRTALKPTRRLRIPAHYVRRRVRVHGRVVRRRVRVPAKTKPVALPRTVCTVPVFGRGGSDTENSLIGVGRSMVVENNYGYQDPTSTTAGKLTVPGFARVDIDRSGEGCRLVWTNSTERAPTVVPKVSLANGLVYTYTKDLGIGDSWYWTALDFRTGRTVYKQLAGTGSISFNNNYAGIAISRFGVEYLGVLSGVVALRDGSRPQ